MFDVAATFVNVYMHLSLLRSAVLCCSPSLRRFVIMQAVLWIWSEFINII